jgi:hypothetical protein
MKKSIFYSLVLLLVSVNIALAQDLSRSYHLFIHQSDCATHVTLYYKLTAKENMGEKDYIITVAKASADLLSTTDTLDKQSDDGLNIYIGMAEQCLKKLQNIYNPDVGDNTVFNLTSIMITNESCSKDNTDTSLKSTNFKSVLNQALQKYNFLCDVDNIKFIDYFNFLTKVTQVIMDTNNSNKLKQDTNDLTVAAYTFFISSFIQATKIPNDILTDSNAINQRIVFTGGYSSLGYKFSNLLKKTEDIDTTENKLRTFVMDAITQEEAIKQKQQPNLLDLPGRSLYSIRDEIDNNESTTSINYAAKGLAISKYCLDNNNISLESDDSDDTDVALIKLKSSTIEVINESVDSLLDLHKNDVNFFSDNSVVIITGDLFDSDFITTKYKQLLDKKISEHQIKSKVSILNMTEIMPFLILAAEKCIMQQ